MTCHVCEAVWPKHQYHRSTLPNARHTVTNTVPRASVRTKMRRWVGAARAACGKGFTRQGDAVRGGQGACPRCPCPEGRQLGGSPLRFPAGAS